MRHILIALCLALTPALAVAQTAPGVAGEALPGQGAATSATSNVTGKLLKLTEGVTLCFNGQDFVSCPAGGGAALATAQVSVGTTAVPIANFRPGRQQLMLNDGLATCVIGPPGVTLSTGYPIPPAGLTIVTTAPVSAVCSTTSTINVLEDY